jgi:predicted anti-sigma-YlaC factor YlaD
MKTSAKAGADLVAAGSAGLAWRYRRNLLRARARLARLERRSTHTSVGPLAVRDSGRFAYAALAAALFASAVVLIFVRDAAWWPTVAFALGPDLAVLYGIAPGLARGQLHPRAVPPYNVLHRLWGPLALAAVALAAGLPLGYVTGALAWAAHVAFDRAIGLRLRSRDGFQRGETRERLVDV